MKRLLTSPVGLWGPVAAYMLLIYSMSSLQQLPQTPGPLTDKHWHALEYGGFAVLWARAFAGGEWKGLSARACVAAVGSSLLYAVTDEWHQAYVPGRDSSVWDLLADAVGASAASAGVYACGIIARSWRGPSLT